MSENVLGYKSISQYKKTDGTTKNYATCILKITDFDKIPALIGIIKAHIKGNHNLDELKKQCFNKDEFIDIETFPWYSQYKSVFLVITFIVGDDTVPELNIYDNYDHFHYNIIGDDGTILSHVFNNAQGYTFLCSWNDQRFDIWDICVGTGNRSQGIATTLLKESISFVDLLIQRYIPTTTNLFNNWFPKPPTFNTDTYNFEPNKITIEIIAQKYNYPALKSFYNAGFRVASKPLKYIDNIPALKTLYPDYSKEEGKIYIHVLYEFTYHIGEQIIALPNGDTFNGLKLDELIINDIETAKDEIESEYASLKEMLKMTDSGLMPLTQCRLKISHDIVNSFRSLLQFPIEIGFCPEYSLDKIPIPGEDRDAYLYTLKNIDLKKVDVSNENILVNNRPGGCVVTITKTSGLFMFHTHPYVCSGKSKLNLMMPSDADLNIIALGNILKLGGNNISTGIVSSHEGIYLYSIDHELQNNILELKNYLLSIPGYSEQIFESVIALIANIINLGGRLSMWRYIKQYDSIEARNIGREKYLDEMSNNTLANLFHEIHNNIHYYNGTNGPLFHDGHFKYYLTPEVLFKEQPNLLSLYYFLLNKSSEPVVNDYNIDPISGIKIEPDAIFGESVPYGGGVLHSLSPMHIYYFLKYCAYTSIFTAQQGLSPEIKKGIFNEIDRIYDAIIKSKIWNIRFYEYNGENIVYDFYTNHINTDFGYNDQTKEYMNNLGKDNILKEVL